MVELIHAWSRLRIPPSLVIDTSVFSYPSFYDMMDYLFKIHYTLYKRVPQRDVSFNPDDVRV